MKPHELIAALMHQEGGSLPLARKMGKPGFQSKIHKFAAGHVANPLRPTAEALAGYFNLPVDAIYDEKVATAIARERGISPLTAEILAAKQKTKRPAIDQEAKQAAATFASLTPKEREAFWQALDAARGTAPAEKAQQPDANGTMRHPPARTARPSGRSGAVMVADVSPKKQPTQPKKEPQHGRRHKNP